LTKAKNTKCRNYNCFFLLGFSGNHVFTPSTFDICDFTLLCDMRQYHGNQNCFEPLVQSRGHGGGGVLTFTFIGNQLFLAIKNIFKKFVLSFLGAFCHRGMLEFFKSA
jgi:hypothetical protein